MSLSLVSQCDQCADFYLGAKANPAIKPLRDESDATASSTRERGVAGDDGVRMGGASAGVCGLHGERVSLGGETGWVPFDGWDGERSGERPRATCVTWPPHGALGWSVERRLERLLGWGCSDGYTCGRRRRLFSVEYDPLHSFKPTGPSMRNDGFQVCN